MAETKPKVDLSEGNFCNKQFDDCILDYTNVNASGSNFTFANLTNCEVRGGNFDGVPMTALTSKNTVWVDTVFGTASLHESIIEGSTFINVDFSNTDISRINFGDSTFINVIMNNKTIISKTTFPVDFDLRRAGHFEQVGDF